MALLKAMGVSVLFLGVWLLCWSAVDRLYPLNPPVRWIALITGALGALVPLVRPVRRLLTGAVDWQSAAEQVEQLDRSFGQKLETVVSQVLAPSNQRASSLILEQLVGQVSSAAAPRAGGKIVSARPAVLAWAAVAGLVVVGVSLSLWPWLNLQQLLARLVMPWAPIAQVTTTSLTVETANARVIQGEPLKIVATTVRLNGDSVIAHLGTDTKNLSVFTMTPIGQNRFELDLPAVDQSTRYFITAGDATSSAYTITALPRPLVTEFRIRYTYPAYTGLPPLTVTNTDGLIEAPIGTETNLTVVSSVALNRASLAIDSEIIELDRTLDLKARQTKFNVTRDRKYTLDLLSDAGVPGHGPEGTVIRALPDRPPIARLGLPENLRANRRDILPLQFEALDDYGIKSINVVTRINGSAEHLRAIPVRGDVRRQAGVQSLDLADLQLNVGDIVQVSLLATDRAGQKTTSPPRQLLISPRSMDMTRQLRLDALLAAQAQAADIEKNLQASRESAEAAGHIDDKFSQPFLDAIAKLTRDATAATESEALVNQSLLRVIVRSDSAAFSIALAGLLDANRVAQTATESAVGLRDATVKAPLDGALAGARRVREALDVLVTGERARALLGDREALHASLRAGPTGDEPAKQRFNKSISRAKEDLAADAAVLSLNPNAGDFEAQLKTRVERADQWTRAQGPVNFPEVAALWARQTKPGLGPRLLVASQAEATRPDAQMSWARDLELCSRAAGRLEQAPADSVDAIKQYPAAFAALDHENTLLRPPETQRKSLDARVVQAADEARRKMRLWAGEDPSKPQENSLAQAMEANQQTADRQYDEARRADEKRNISASAAADKDNSAAQRVDQAVNRAEAIDRLAAEQAKLNLETKTSANQSSNNDLARRQEQLAEAIKQATEQAKSDDAQGQKADSAASGKVPDAPAEAAKPGEASSPDEPADWREGAQATIASAQQQLAAMPEGLRQTQNATATEHNAAARKQAAQALAGSNSPSDLKQLAGRAADIETQNQQLAREKLDQAARPVDPALGENLSAHLGKFAPQTAEATAVIDQSLTPALRSLQQASRAGDTAGTNRATADARAAIESAQKALVRAQEQLVDRDPLLAAKWFAEQSRDALKQNPPDMARARQNQQQAARALNKAWDRSVHEAGRQRLAGIPSMVSVFSLYPFTGEAAPAVGPGSAGLAMTGPVNAASRWARFRARGDAELSTPVRESDPPEYQDALKAYFEALGRIK